MAKIFDTVRISAPKRSAFDLSHEKKLSCKFGKLYPILLQETLPGDVFSGRSEVMVRMAPMIAPIMHRIDVHIHYFNVPNRIVWDEWEDFITGGDLGADSPPLPEANCNTLNRCEKGTLPDYFGLPVATAAFSVGYFVNGLPFMAYHEIWNEYYRDQTLQEKFDITAVNTQAFFDLKTRAWEKDYFTSALPFPQKGPAVNLPLDLSYSPQYKDTTDVRTSTGSIPADSSLDSDNGLLATNGNITSRVENLEASQTIDTTNVTIEELRQSSRLQEWLEIAARAGTRYKELIKSMFGVSTGDARLDRPEYLGGGKIPITISEVVNTTGTAEAAQGEMAGHGIGVSSTPTWKCKVKEHGHIIGMLSILPKSGYQQGIHKNWLRLDKFDYYWEKFANIGEQAVINRELYHDFEDNTYNLATFGYQQRYAEYKYAINSVHGDFRDDLDEWHLSRIFGTQPNLNADFIECDNANLQRIFAVIDPTIDKFYIQIYNQVKARRPMPFFSTPTL